MEPLLALSYLQGGATQSQMKRYFFSLAVLVLTGLSPRAHAEFLSVIQDFNTVRAFPNPWRSDLHSSSPMTFDRLPEAAVTTLRIFTISGEHVRTLSGTQSMQWDMRNDRGDYVASGIYLYLLNANGQQKSGKIAVIR
jgi:hypothetical protein